MEVPAISSQDNRQTRGPVRLTFLTNTSFLTRYPRRHARPGAKHPPNHRDLAGVIAVVRDHLPKHGLECSREFRIAFVPGCDLPLHFVHRRLRQPGEISEQPSKALAQPVPVLRIARRRCGWEALRRMFRIRRPLAANAAHFILHPIIHVENKLSDGVRKSRDRARSQFGGKILHTGKRIRVSAFPPEQFSQCA